MTATGPRRIISYDPTTFLPTSDVQSAGGTQSLGTTLVPDPVQGRISSCSTYAPFATSGFQTRQFVYDPTTGAVSKVTTTFDQPGGTTGTMARSVTSTDSAGRPLAVQDEWGVTTTMSSMSSR